MQKSGHIGHSGTTGLDGRSGEEKQLSQFKRKKNKVPNTCLSNFLKRRDKEQKYFRGTN